MLIKNFNRWAIVDYLKSYGEHYEDDLFVKIAESIDTDVRPVLSANDNEVVEHLIQRCDQYKMHQKLCIEVVDILRGNGFEDDHIVNFVSALMHDSTERDREWEHRHHEFENRSNSGFRVDYMSMNPREDDYLNPHRVV